METELEVTEVSYKKIVPVRFRPGEKTYSFGTDDLELHKDDEVVVETVRGLEIGTVMAEPADGKPELDSVIKPVIRKATSYDLSQQARNKADEPEAMERCRAAIDQCGLPMVLTSAEYTLDRSKIIFTYVAEERVDFRELLKVLASMFRTRIELRQIGPRDTCLLICLIVASGAARHLPAHLPDTRQRGRATPPLTQLGMENAKKARGSTSRAP